MPSERMLSVREVASHYGVNPRTVLRWIRCGELQAFTVNCKLGAKKPRFRISPEALTAFELRRMHSPEPPRVRRRQSADTINYY